MTVRDTLRWLRFGRVAVPGCAGGVLVVSLLIAAADPRVALLMFFPAALAAAYVYEEWTERARGQLLLRKHAELVSARDDPAKLRAVWDDIEDGYAALELQPDLYLRIMSAWVLLEEERWPQARAVLESVDTRELEDEDERSTYANNLAWALAHDGAPDKAIAVAERALANSPGSPPYAACLWGTLGAAQTLTGEHAQAVSSLRRAIELDDTPASQGIRHYYLGIALRALGDTAGAVEAWQRAQQVAPREWQARAASKLRSIPTPYR